MLSRAVFSPVAAMFMNRPLDPSHVAAAAVLVLAAASPLGAQPRVPDPVGTPAAVADPFWSDAKAGANLRTFYMNRDIPDNTPTKTDQEAWAFGGALFGRTGWWADTVQFGGTYYLSLPLYAPDDRDGTKLLALGQKTISVLGEAFVRARYAGNTLTVGRQEIDMNPARLVGVRSNRSDATFVGRQDNRMIPITYEAAMLAGKPDPSFNYFAGYIGKAKPVNQAGFDPIGEVFGAKGSDSGMYTLGVQWSPVKDAWTQAWYHEVPDVLRIAFLDGDFVNRLSKTSYLRIGAQYASQGSVGANALTGGSFSTYHAGLYGEFGWSAYTVYGALTQTGSGADLRLPFTSGPHYTQQLVRSFTRAGEATSLIGIGVNLDSVAKGLSAWTDWTAGRDAVRPGGAGPLPDETELNVGLVWTYRDKGSILDNLRVRARAGWITDKTPAGDKHTTDYRIDVNLPIVVF
jgi:hypothetical protein